MTSVEAADTPGLCELVRRSCRATTGSAELVRIDDAGIDRLASTLTAVDVIPTSAEARRPDADPEQVAANVVAVNAINFGSGYHDVVRKEPGLSGSRTMAARWGRYVKAERIEVERLQAITVDDCLAIFDQDPADREHVELMALFAEALARVGDFIAERFDGTFMAMIEQASGSAEALAESLLAMPFYLDRQPLGDQTVHFYKRAQLTAADLARALPDVAAARFTDLDRLTAFADNLVPHVLMVDGLLIYDPDVLATIESHRLIAAGSRAEVEIRASAVEVVERLTAALRRREIAARAMDIDLWLWERGGDARYKARPRHRTRCPFY